jgi:NADH-quinone oxidoreductase subunit F
VTGLELRGGTIGVDERTLSTGRPGLFAGGDVATGPNTVIDAIAAGKRAADVIDLYLKGQAMVLSAEPRLPTVYVEPVVGGPQDGVDTARVEMPTLSVKQRRGSFTEIEETLTVAAAAREARRCLRCDLEFTQRPQTRNAALETGGGET